MIIYIVTFYLSYNRVRWRIFFWLRITARRTRSTGTPVKMRLIFIKYDIWMRVICTREIKMVALLLWIFFFVFGYATIHMLEWIEKKTGPGKHRMLLFFIVRWLPRVFFFSPTCLPRVLLLLFSSGNRH